MSEAGNGAPIPWPGNVRAAVKQAFTDAYGEGRQHIVDRGPGKKKMEVTLDGLAIRVQLLEEEEPEGE